ncbi:MULTISPECIES: efflux RND transporter permease subunit [unclassified Siphonobacter]|uniref:efflux RND transporter permease subunit n=1 Tax=unclassified Siphonobacter TaxID=2635712 RepID=UPI000CBC8CF3|nr:MULTISPECIES: efflux RND transporter permease subunit [unclassified Siphonobacter]MDQ1087615.1 HAE1 family hydrophobic/amphiphilic exporter-1 [Siphonobacter sp. SORGH_AS_1065]MDR6193766.1 HAE1 family hydrophobic/amphiphilic exporter-1 [Siphonobacter sp. SORGH_AS_0500]PKK37944.1 hydrophobe/amphiphile efflux-1 family RND transporter [Siphonobacter sp. SORGH_AS_0500]
MFKQFIHRPVLAIVISLVIVFTGILAINSLPISQFPEISPPMVIVRASYPGASAKVLTESVLIPMEQAINGVPGMKYMTSDATSAGEANIQVVFNLGTNPDQAVLNINTRIAQVLNRLPVLVQREGVIVNRIVPNMLMYVNLYSKDPHADMKFLFNFAGVNMIPELQRLNGIGQASILGSRQYAMRIWLKPDRMRAYNISAEEVMDALDEQSVIGSPGRLGRSDGKRAEALEYVLTYQGRFNEVEQYKNVIVRANPNGEILYLKDVANVELGSEYYDIYSNLNGYPSAAIVLKQTYGSNASDVIKEVKAKLDELKKSSFPPGMDYKISYDVSNFLDASIENVIHTLRDAFILVALVVFIFLGDWRSTLIPTIAVPVSLVGAFMFMQLFGLTINMITLFALVLAIGIVVDDAIVVVEAVHAKMEEEHLSPYKAVKKVLNEISGAVIAITLLMTAVFIPVAFMSGPVGIFYRQFSITMATSIVLSGLVALTLTPVLCAMILKNNHGKPRKKTILNRGLDAFNRGFDKLTGKYTGLLRLIVNRRVITFGILLAFGAGIFGISTTLPSGFIPSEDQGMIYAIIQTPPGSTLERTNDIGRKLQAIAEKVEGIESVSALAGYEVLTEGRGSNAGTCLINLKPWSERKQTVNEIIYELEEKAKVIPGATIEFFDPPAVPGYGAAGGFSLQLLDKTNSGDYQQLQKVSNDFMAELKKRKELTGLFTFFSANYPQYELEIDNKLAMQKGVSIGKAMNTLSILIGSSYELGFIKFQRFFKVFVQAGPEYRRLPDDLMQLYVKNNRDEMVPFSAFMKIKKTQGANEINRYNMYTTAAFRGAPAKGYSSGEAIKVIQEVAAKTLPRGFDIDWAGLSKDEVVRGNEAVVIFLIVLAFVYMVLAAQYESFILPLAVIFSLPAGIFGSFLLIKTMGLANDIYAQVGLVMLVGLLGKNAVLIVEFAVQRHEQGVSVFEAAIEGAKERFRPILMTSFAFIAGLIPLVIATGPGAIGNRTIGSSALGGMLFGTVFGVIIVPGLYYIFGSIAAKRKLIKHEDENPLTEEIEHHG